MSNNSVVFRECIRSGRCAELVGRECYEIEDDKLKSRIGFWGEGNDIAENI